MWLYYAMPMSALVRFLDLFDRVHMMASCLMSAHVRRSHRRRVRCRFRDLFNDEYLFVHFFEFLFFLRTGYAFHEWRHAPVRPL